MAKVKYRIHLVLGETTHKLTTQLCFILDTTKTEIIKQGILLLAEKYKKAIDNSINTDNIQPNNAIKSTVDAHPLTEESKIKAKKLEYELEFIGIDIKIDWEKRLVYIVRAENQNYKEIKTFELFLNS